MNRRECQNAVSNRSKTRAYSITSSARASSVGGTVRPSALAALIRRSCYNKAHDLEHGFHTPALLGES